MQFVNTQIYKSNIITLKGSEITFSTADIKGQYLSKIFVEVLVNNCVVNIEIFETNKDYTKQKLVEQYQVSNNAYFVLPGFGYYIFRVKSSDKVKNVTCKIRTYTI